MQQHRVSLNHEFEVLLGLVCESVAEFRFYNSKCVAVSIGTSKNRGRGGIWAYVVPLRYVGGKVHRKCKRSGVTGRSSYQTPGLSHSHPDALYIMSFMFPRFFALSARERLETIVHELYHLHPTMRGDLRRFKAPHVYHGPTPAAYDRKVKELTSEALSYMPELLNHPLIVGKEGAFTEHSKKRLKLPRRVFEPLPLWPLETNTRNPTLPVRQTPPMRRPDIRSNLHVEHVPTNLLSLIVGALFFFLLVNLALSQQLEVRSKSPLFHSPSTHSENSGSVSSGSSVKFVRYSASRRWMLVEADGGKQGWIPANFVNNPPSTATVSPSKGKNGPEDELGDEFSTADIDEETFEAPAKTDLADISDNISKQPKSGNNSKPRSVKKSKVSDSSDGFIDEEPEGTQQQLQRRLREYDQQFIKFFSRKKAKLFEKPVKFSNRYGLILPNDELQVLKLSKSKRWAQVRLALTGEEGWFPSVWIFKKVQEHLKPFGPNTLGFGLDFGSGSRNLGAHAEYYYNLSEAGSESSPRDRLECGGGLNYFLGKGLADGTKTYAVKFLDLELAGRYLKSAPDGQLSGGAEAGVFAQYTMAKFANFDAATLAAAGLPSSGTAIGFLFGGVGFLALSESFQVSVGLRAYFASGTIFSIRTGANYRF